MVLGPFTIGADSKIFGAFAGRIFTDLNSLFGLEYGSYEPIIHANASVDPTPKPKKEEEEKKRKINNSCLHQTRIISKSLENIKNRKREDSYLD